MVHIWWLCQFFTSSSFHCGAGGNLVLLYFRIIYVHDNSWSDIILQPTPRCSVCTHNFSGQCYLFLWRWSDHSVSCWIGDRAGWSASINHSFSVSKMLAGRPYSIHSPLWRWPIVYKLFMLCVGADCLCKLSVPVFMYGGSVTNCLLAGCVWEANNRCG